MHGDGATGSCVILVTPDGERSMNTHLGMCEEFSRVDLAEALLARSDFLELIREHVDVVFANLREAGILFGEQADDGLARLLGEHVEVGVLKTGKDGSITAYDGELIRTPGNDVEVVDTTGAGDMFAAGFLAGFTLGQSVDRASVLAGKLAERVIAKTGAQFGFDEIVAIRSELLVPPNAPAD